MSLQIEQDDYRVTLTRGDVTLAMDFEPIAREFDLSLKQNWVLVHWQAKPFGEREWGVFCCEDGKLSYLSTLKVVVTMPGTGVQIDEAKTQSRPSAVLLYRNAVARKPRLGTIVSVLPSRLATQK